MPELTPSDLPDLVESIDEATDDDIDGYLQALMETMYPTFEVQNS